MFDTDSLELSQDTLEEHNEVYDYYHLDDFIDFIHEYSSLNRDYHRIIKWVFGE